MITQFFHPSVGGIEGHVLNLSRQLVERGHKVTVVTSRLWGTQRHDKIQKDLYVERLASHFLPRVPYASLSSVGYVPNLKKKIIDLVKQKNVAIIHAHGHHYPMSWTAINVSRTLGVPSVLTLHGIHALEPESHIAFGIEELFNHLMFRRLLAKTNALIALTKTISEYADRYGAPKEKQYIIPNGVEQNVFARKILERERLKKHYNVPADKAVILFRGRFAHVKGALEMAEAVVTLGDERDDVFFLFVGEGRLQKEIERKLEPLKDRVKIFGWAAADKTPDLYVVADIYVCPSRWEALPITILEAMASHLYIVATPVGGIPDILEGYISKTYISKPAAPKIIEALQVALKSYRERRELRTIPERFDWSHIAFEVEQIYEKIIEPRLK